MSLATAAEALEQHDLARALSALLAAWRTPRHPRIANAIDVAVLNPAWPKLSCRWFTSAG